LVARQAAQGTNTIGFGEMGIGNTSSAALLMHHFTGIPLAECVGKGTGTNNEQYAQKLQTLQAVVEKHSDQLVTNNEALAAYGGFEIAMMVGAYLGAMEQEMIIVVDGFIATAALLVATAMDKRVLQNCLFAHTSGEKGHAALLDHLAAKPLLQLGMRLGEGTGAALAIPLLQAAAAFMEQMASFESAGVDQAS
jgi:nicotinate-nucleotide--dimethylbenzimidazole phosphoribosyltransferase